MQHSATKEIAVGIMFILGLIGLFGVSFWVAGSSLGFGVETNFYVFSFPTVEGVQAGTTVFFNGIEKGVVKEVTPDLKAGRANVVCAIEADIAISRNAQIEIRTNLFNNTYIFIVDNDPADEMFKPGTNDPIPGKVLANAVDQFSRITEQGGDILAEARGVVSQLNIAVSSLNDPVRGGFLYKLINDQEFSGDVHELILNMRDAAGTFNDAGMDLRSLVQDLEQGDGPLPRLLFDAEMAQNLDHAMRGIADASTDFSATMSDIRSLTRGITDDTNIVGLLLNNQQARENLAAFLTNLSDASAPLVNTIAALESITTKINAGVGTLGQLVNNDDLLVQAMQALRSASTTLEDLRETAPITTFSSLLFQAFQ